MTADNKGPQSAQKPDGAIRGAVIQGTLGLIGALIGAVALIFAARVSQQSQDIQATSTAIAGTSTQGAFDTSQAPTYTPLPSQTPYPTYTFEPTQTPYPTYTPRPTLTAIPLPSLTPTVANVLFEDNFDNGLSSSWQVLSGDPVVVNSSLTFNQKTWIAVGEMGWTNYVVRFETSNLRCQFGVYDNAVVIGVHFQDTNNMVALRWSACGGLWSTVENGKWTDIPNTGFKLPAPFSENVRRPEVTVSGNSFKVSGGSSIVLDNYPSGMVAILADPTVVIDNLIITGLP